MSIAVRTVPAQNPAAGLLATLLSLVLLSCLMGCSRDVDPVPDEAPRHPVSGTLTLDGEPGERVVVTFTPRDGTPGLGGYAIVDAAGKFSAIDLNGKEGLQQGDYYVTFSKRTMLDGSPIPPDVPNGIDTLEVLSPRLTTISPEDHPYVASVTGPTDILSYDLKSNKAR